MLTLRRNRSLVQRDTTARKTPGILPRHVQLVHSPQERTTQTKASACGAQQDCTAGLMDSRQLVATAARASCAKRARQCRTQIRWTRRATDRARRDTTAQRAAGWQRRAQTGRIRTAPTSRRLRTVCCAREASSAQVRGAGSGSRRGSARQGTSVSADRALKHLKLRMSIWLTVFAPVPSWPVSVRLDQSARPGRASPCRAAMVSTRTASESATAPYAQPVTSARTANRLSRVREGRTAPRELGSM